MVIEVVARMLLGGCCGIPYDCLGVTKWLL